jgi:hypothetical protein
MVLITPHLVRPLNPDEVPALPTSIQPLIKRGDIGQQLDGAGGVVDAPAGKKNARFQGSGNWCAPTGRNED